MELFFFCLMVVIFVTMFVCLFLYKVRESGKDAKKWRELLHTSVNLKSQEKLLLGMNATRATKRHRRWVGRFFVSFVVMVLCIELMVWSRYGSPATIRLLGTSLGMVHLGSCFIFFTLFIIMRWFVTGVKYPVWHTVLSKFLIGTFVLVLLTGAWLTIRLVNSM